MKNIIVGIAIGIISITGYVVLKSERNFQGGGVINYSTIKSDNASSSAMTIGDELSTQILAERSLRNSWSACYDTQAGGSGSIYLILSDTAVVGTTTGVLVELESGECYFSERESVYADIVHAIGLAATTTDVLFVTETFNSN